MSGPTDDTYFTEEQHFPLWIKAFPLLTAALAAVLVVILAIGGLWSAAVIAAALLVLVLLPLAVLHLAMKLVTTLDASGLHLRIHPARCNLLPRRMAEKDVPFGDIDRWTVRTYHSLTSREFWGWHLWGLSAAKGGRYLYIMQPSGPTTGQGVQIELKGGGVLLIGSKDPDRLANLVGSMIGRRS